VLPLRTLVYFYRRRLRVHWMQELLAAVGIATGVALVFGVQVANTSITGSAKQIVHAIAGDATLQLSARDTTGFDADLLRDVRAVDGVSAAAGILEQRVTVEYDGRTAMVDLIGVDQRMASLGGMAARNFQLGGLAYRRGILLPLTVGDQLRLPPAAAGGPLPEVRLGVRGAARTTTVSAVLGSETVGGLAQAMVAVGSLRYVQELSGLTGRVSRVLVVAEPGQEAAVRAGLERVADDRLNVTPVSNEIRLLEQATGPIDQSTGLFAAIAAFVGLLFVFNAMLLTVPERRRFIADLRIIGYRSRQIVQIIVFQAVTLGAVASLVGVGVGYLLSRTAAQHPPGYLALAFPLGLQPVVEPLTVAIALAGGIVVACIGAAQPLFDLRSSRAVDAVFSEHGEPGHSISGRMRRTMAAVAVAVLALTTALALAWPALTMVGVAGLALAVVLVVPAAFAAALRVTDWVARRAGWNMLLLAARALRATTVRSLALAATGAVAVFGTIAIEGAHQNLLSGLYQDYAEYVGTADVWIATPDDDLALQPFSARELARRVDAVPGVSAVRPYHGGLLDLGGRRVWLIARPPEDAMQVPRSQILDGDPALTERRLRAGGWVVVSEQVADQQGAAVGERLTLQTPTGTARFRIAATTTNLGWGAGAVVLNRADYRAHWPLETPTALEVDVESGHDAAQVARAVEEAMGPEVTVRAQTTGARAAHANALARDGLARLSQIAALLLVAAALALAAAMGAGVWQRRATFAQLRIEGFRSAKLWRALLLESAIVLAVGCMLGAVTGVFGQFLLDRWLQLSTGYPAPFTFTLGQTALSSVFVALAALIVMLVPGYLVSRTPARLGLDGV
jgi:putative ABC transport system permease protein